MAISHVLYQACGQDFQGGGVYLGKSRPFRGKWTENLISKKTTLESPGYGPAYFFLSAWKSVLFCKIIVFLNFIEKVDSFRWGRGGFSDPPARGLYIPNINDLTQNVFFFTKDCRTAVLNMKIRIRNIAKEIEIHRYWLASVGNP